MTFGEKESGKRLAVAHNVSSSEVSDNCSCAQCENDPDDSNCSGFLDLRRLLDGHEADKDVRHTEVAETPAQTSHDLLPGSCERIRAECSNAIVECAVICRIKVTYRVHDNRYCEERDEHHEALEEVCPANGLITAQKCVDEDQYCKDDHGEMLVCIEPGQY